MKNFAVRIQHRSRPQRTRAKAGPPTRDPLVMDLEKGFCAYIASVVSAALGPSFTPRAAAGSASSASATAAQAYRQQPTANTTAATASGSASNTATTTSINTHSGLVHLEPSPRLTTTGCWCPNPAIPRPHCWSTCTVFIPKPIVAPSAALSSCAHHASSTTASSAYIFNPDSPPCPSTVDHLFCFDPIAAAAMYMSWFLAVPGPPEAPVPEDDASYLGHWMCDCYYTDDHYRSYNVPNPYLGVEQGGHAAALPLYDSRWGELPRTDEQSEAHFAMISRLFMDLRKEPPKSSRAGCWYDAERVHAVIRWDLMSVRKSMDDFLPYLLQAKADRLQQAYSNRAA